MNLQQLEYALNLRQFGSYSRAAKAVGISQPAMSVQVKKLEEETNLTLFDRSRNKVVTTEAGEQFLAQAQLLITQARQLRDLAEELSNNYTGDLRIGVIPTLAPYLLPLFIQQLNEQFSQLKIHITEATTEDILHLIKTGELDGGIISTPINSKTNFTTTPLFYEGMMLFVSPDHPLFAKKKIDILDIPLQDIWLLKEGNCFRDQVTNICEVARREEAQHLFFFESNSIESLCRIVEFKGGITFLPELTTLHLSSDREDMIKPLSGPKRVREISLVHLPNHIKQRTMDQLVDVIRSSIPKKMLKKGATDPIPTNIQV